MKLTNDVKEKISIKVVNQLPLMNGIATNGCLVLGFNQPKGSTALLKQNIK